MPLPPLLLKLIVSLEDGVPIGSPFAFANAQLCHESGGDDGHQRRPTRNTQGATTTTTRSPFTALSPCNLMEGSWRKRFLLKQRLWDGNNNVCEMDWLNSLNLFITHKKDEGQRKGGGGGCDLAN